MGGQKKGEGNECGLSRRRVGMGLDGTGHTLTAVHEDGDDTVTTWWQWCEDGGTRAVERGDRSGWVHASGMGILGVARAGMAPVRVAWHCWRVVRRAWAREGRKGGRAGVGAQRLGVS